MKLEADEMIVHSRPLWHIHTSNARTTMLRRTTQRANGWCGGVTSHPLEKNIIDCPRLLWWQATRGVKIKQYTHEMAWEKVSRRTVHPQRVGFECRPS